MNRTSKRRLREIIKEIQDCQETIEALKDMQVKSVDVGDVDAVLQFSIHGILFSGIRYENDCRLKELRKERKEILIYGRKRKKM